MMNKKFGIALIALLPALCLSLGLAACGGENGGPVGHVHTYTVENVCSGCGDKWEYTEGLSYMLDTETDTYMVTGVNTALDGVEELALVIPYGYQGKFVTAIRGDAFNNSMAEEYSKLTSVTIPGSVKTIGTRAFACCNALTSIELPKSVTEIGSAAFSYCVELTSITLPDGVTEIGSAAFSYCVELTSIEIPKSVTEIGSGAFSYCVELTEIHYAGTIDEWKEIKKTDELEPQVSNYTVVCTDGTIAADGTETTK